MGLAGKASGFKLGLFLVLFLLFFLPVQSAKSDSIQYIYDNLGRLVMTESSSGTVIIYGYDDAGRLISTTRTTVNNQPPVLTGISPNQVFIGNEVSVTITGNNLLQTQSVTSDNSGVQIRNFTSTNNSVMVDIIISKTTSTGPADFTVQNLNGSASISMNLLNLTFDPVQIAMLNGASASITAKIDGLASDYNLTLSNQNPNIIQAPQSLIVPVAGSASFVVNGISYGTGTISAGNSGISVFVGLLYSGVMSPSSAMVSVSIKPTIQAPANSSPVSVNITPTIQSPANSLPVSVSVKSNFTAPVVSQPVSAGIGNAIGY